jgi:hypothetical protein
MKEKEKERKQLCFYIWILTQIFIKEALKSKKKISTYVMVVFCCTYNLQGGMTLDGEEI